MNAGVRAEAYGNPTAQDHLVTPAHQTPSPRKRKVLAIVNTIMRIQQDLDFADDYLRVVEEMAVGSVGIAEDMEEEGEQKWKRRKRKIEMFQEEVWEVFLEGRVPNPFKEMRMHQKERGIGGTHGHERIMPHRVRRWGPEPEVMRRADGVCDPGMLLFPARNDSSGEAGACVGGLVVSGHVVAVICKESLTQMLMSPRHRSPLSPPTQPPSADTSYHMAQALLAMSR